jgi:hypothetical protein
MVRGVSNKLAEVSRVKKILLIIGLVLIISMIYYISKEPPLDNDDEGILGEVWGPLEVEGEITASDSFLSQSFGIYGYDEFGSTVMVNVTNVSEVTVIERAGGIEFEKTYTLDNKDFSIIIHRGSLYCDLSNGEFSFRFKEFYGEPQEEEKYLIFTDYDMIEGKANLVHNTTGEYDIRTYRYVTAKINDEFLYLTKGDFIIPSSEIAQVSIGGHGIYHFDVMPIISVNGTIIINDFHEVSDSGLAIRKIPTMKISDSDIQISTVQLPDFDEGILYHIPWIIRINSDNSDDVEIETSVDYRLMLILLSIISLYLVLIYTVLR